MKKILLFLLPAMMLLFSCKKDSSSGTQATTTLKKVIIHVVDTSEVDTILFSYDSQGRLAGFADGAIDTAQGISSYSADNVNFIYSGNNKQPFEYAYNDNSGNAFVSLLTFNSNEQLAVDSMLYFDFNLYVNYSTNLIANSYSTNGIPDYNSDSLWFDGNGNLSQWAEDTIVDPTASPVLLSRSFAVSYNSYTTYNNPLYSFNNVAEVLLEYSYLGDPAFLYSKNLLSTESEDGFQYSYQYVLNGSTVEEANGPLILNFYY